MVPAEDLTLTLELILRAQGGDRGALERLLEHYYERVRRIVRIRLGSSLRPRIDSGDILHETFLAAIRDFERVELSDEASFVNWLAVLAENQIRQVPPESTDGSDPVGTGPAPPGPAPPGLPGRIEEVARLEAAMERLPDEYREVILLRDYAGAAWDLIAEQTRRPGTDAARRMHARALMQLARLARGDSGSDSRR